MDILSHFIQLVVALALVAAGFMYLFNPRRAFETLKKLGITLLGLIFGMALLGELLPALRRGGDPSELLVLLAVSLAAYFIRESRLKRKNKEARRIRGAERTPVMPTDFTEDDE